MKPKKRIYSNYGSRSWSSSQNKSIMRVGFGWIESGRCSMIIYDFRTVMVACMRKYPKLKNYTFVKRRSPT